MHSTEGYRESGASMALSVGARGGARGSRSRSCPTGVTGQPRPGRSGRGDGLYGCRPPTRSGAWAMDARGSYGVRIGHRFLRWFGTVSRPAEGLRLTLGGRFANEAS